MKIARLCEEFSVLPNAGGLFDQPSNYIDRLDAVMRARDRVEEVEAGKQAAIHRLKAGSK